MGLSTCGLAGGFGGSHGVKTGRFPVMARRPDPARHSFCAMVKTRRPLLRVFQGHRLTGGAI
jgi:hypothetical protein